MPGHKLARRDDRLTKLYPARYRYAGGEIEWRMVCFNHYMLCMHGLDAIPDEHGVVRYEAVEVGMARQEPPE